MKKGLVFSSAILATMALASCSSNEVFDGGDGSQASSGQVIEIAVENAGSGLESRSGRPLYSSEAAQDIDNVKVVIVDASGNVAAEEMIENWMTSDKVIAYDDASGHGRKIRIELTGDDKIADGDYTVYAIGYSGDTSYKVGTESLHGFLNSVTKGSSKDLKDLALINQNTNRAQAEEIFAGSTTLNVVNKKFSQGVTLHRQVAGIFTYVKNIPYIFNKDGVVGTKLQLVAAKTNLNLILGNFYGMTLSNNGNQDASKEPNKLMNVVNGTADRGGVEKVVYTIDLNDWFKELKDVNNDGILDRYEYKQDESGKLVEDKGDGKQIWKNPLRGVGQDQPAAATFVKGSAFGGEFIIPFQQVSGTVTFQLRMVNAAENQVLRTWSISLPDDDLISGSTLQWWNGAWTNGTVTESKSNYSVLRNHLYGVGTKDSADPDTDGTNPDPETPTPDVDDPQDLTTKQDIMLQVNDNWEVIHKMEVE
ncbi:MAG: hypothetical protein H9789_05025 [Candidatus Paraprevotella stercoravium]|uniref:Major fimbrial subunit protein N-terminal domain-containing protein n=1 Tax=Candidatus Paraprevotella stercoravium TaxID=2838725 RepID=A0A9E2L6S0_9BACT|nr:hypothetical protein [Candidatus Paraprevotella stercoravium]